MGMFFNKIILEIKRNINGVEQDLDKDDKNKNPQQQNQNNQQPQQQDQNNQQPQQQDQNNQQQSDTDNDYSADTDNEMNDDENNDTEDNSEDEGNDYSADTDADSEGDNSGDEGNDYSADTDADSEGDEGNDYSADTDADSDEDYYDDDSGDSDSSSTDDTENKTKQLQDDILKDLSPQQLDIKIKELKQKYLDLHEVISNVLIRTAKIEKNSNNMRVVEFICLKLEQLKDLIYFYITNTFDTKTYIENCITYQEFLVNLNTINKLFQEIQVKK